MKEGKSELADGGGHLRKIGLRVGRGDPATDRTKWWVSRDKVSLLLCRGMIHQWLEASLGFKRSEVFFIPAGGHCEGPAAWECERAEFVLGGEVTGAAFDVGMNICSR